MCSKKKSTKKALYKDKSNSKKLPKKMEGIRFEITALILVKLNHLFGTAYNVPNQNENIIKKKKHN
jgi:hypothetical protein